MTAVEVDNNVTVNVPAQTCVPFWPRSQNPVIKAVVHASGERYETKPFRYDISENTTLVLNCEVGH